MRVRLKFVHIFTINYYVMGHIPANISAGHYNDHLNGSRLLWQRATDFNSRTNPFRCTWTTKYNNSRVKYIITRKGRRSPSILKWSFSSLSLLYCYY